MFWYVNRSISGSISAAKSDQLREPFFASSRIGSRADFKRLSIDRDRAFAADVGFRLHDQLIASECHQAVRRRWRRRGT